MPGARPAERELLTTLLKQVSRSFYLTLRVLPKSIRRQIGVTYLLARTTDTIADTDLVPVDQRLRAMRDLRERILGEEPDPPNFGVLAHSQATPAERALLERCDASLALLAALSGADRMLVREVLTTITSGQELDLQRFAQVSPAAELTVRRIGTSLERQPKEVVALQTELELEDYTYRVAGCVGEFWTKLCRAHEFGRARLDDFFLLMNGKRFGQGLQLVNILRDLPVDLRRGRCYLPAQRLSTYGLTPVDLLEPTNEPRLRPLYDKYLEKAQSHLVAGWVYTNTLPRNCVRVRLACAWPVLIGLRTIERLRAGKVLDPAQRIKISRREVRKIVRQTILLYPFRGAWHNLSGAVRHMAVHPDAVVDSEEEKAVKTD